MSRLTENWTLSRSRKLGERKPAPPARDEQRRLAGLTPLHEDWCLFEEEEMDILAFNTELAKELKKLKKDAGVKSIKQEYRGTGSQKFRRQLWVRFKNGAVIDLWLDRKGLGLGGVVARRPDDSASPEPIPKSVPYAGKSPAEVYREAARLLKMWAHAGL